MLKDGNTAYVHTNDLTEEGLLKAAELATHAAGSTYSVDRSINLDLKAAKFELDFLRLPEDVEITEKINHVLAANNIARELDDEISQVTVSVADMQRKVQIANSDGILVEDEMARVRMAVNVIAVRDGLVQTGYEAAGGVSGWEILDQVSLEDMARQAASRAVSLLSAVPAPAGRNAGGDACRGRRHHGT